MSGEPTGTPVDRRRLGGLTRAEGAAWGGFLRAHAELTRVMNEELEAQHRLPLRSYDVLRQVALAPDARLRMAELARRVVLTRPGLTGVVQRLEAEGLLRRSPDPTDGRGAYACLTTEGKRRLLEAHRTHVASIRMHFARRLTNQEQDTLAAIWTKLEAPDP